MKARNYSETKVVYNEDEETYAQRQLREFFFPRPQRIETVADWAPAYDPLNGKKAGAKEVRGPFGREE